MNVRNLLHYTRTYIAIVQSLHQMSFNAETRQARKRNDLTERCVSHTNEYLHHGTYFPFKYKAGDEI